MTSPRLARPTHVARLHVEWYRHARMGALIRALGGRTAFCRRADRDRLRRWYMLGHEVA